MADVATSVSASSPSSGMLSDMLLPDSSELTMLSPGVKEAMDRIFPQSATQLLQPRHFEGDENLLGRDKISTPISNSAMHTRQPSNTTDSVSTTMSHNIGSSPLSDHRKTGKEDGEGKKLVSKFRISKADLEIISNHRLDQRESLDGSNRSRKRDSLHTYSSSECPSQGGSDSEDMCRPFAIVAKARKKGKQHKRKKKETTSTWQSIDQVCRNDSEDEFMSREGNNLNEKLEEGAVKYHMPMKELDCRRESSQSSDTNFSETSKTSRTNLLCSMDPSVSDNSSQHTVPENGSVSESSVCKEFNLTNEDVSNISFSSSKENLQGQRVSSGQKLPKVRKCFYNTKKERRKIRRTFPHCYVVLNRLNLDTHQKVDFHVVDNVPLYAVRLKCLKKLCTQGSIKCRGRTKKNFGMHMNHWHTNPFGETEGAIANSDEEFECPRGGRSLRRRNQNISYAEPSESIDDLLDDVSISHSSTKKADSGLESGLSKTKKGKQNLSEHNGESALHGANETEKGNTAAQKEKMADKKEKAADTIDSNKTTHIVVYPNKNKEKKPDDVVVEKARNKSEGDKGKRKSPKSTSAASVTSLPNSSTVSVLVNSASLRPQYVSKNTLLPPPPLRLGIPGNILSMGPRPYISAAPLPAMTPPGMPKSQYCMMKVDGKDVLVQLVPSGLLGRAQSGPPQAVILPSGKKNFTTPSPFIPRNLPPHHFMGQSIIPQAHLLSSSQIGQIPTTTVATSIPPGASSTASFPNFLVPATLGVRTSSFSALPVVPISQLAAFTNTHSSRPIMALSSGAVRNTTSVTTSVSLLSVSSTTKVTNSTLTTVTPSSTASTVPSAVRTTSSLLTSMAAPSCTTVVHSIRAPTSNNRVPVSNQSSSMRSLRVFVPGCSATGTPGHFTTLASIGNTSPLTRLSASSELLPQRKRPSEELTQEQQAAKRRKLEKKYPLPPGVVIKTEPLDSITSTTKVTLSASGTGMRSLLRQNIQVISASWAGGSGNTQSIRIISPSLASALSVRPARPVSTNVVYRAATVSGGQTVLVPIPLSTVSATITPSARTFSVAASTCTAVTTTTISTRVNSTPVSTLSTATETISITTSGGKSSTPSVSENTFSPPVLIQESLHDRALALADSDCCSESSAPVLSPTLMPNLFSSPEAQPSNGGTIEMTHADTANCSPSCVTPTAVTPSNSLTGSAEGAERISVMITTTEQSSAAEGNVSESSVCLSNIPHTSPETVSTATSSSASSLATTSTSSSLLSGTTCHVETPTTESDAGESNGLALIQADSLSNLVGSLLTTVNNLKQLVKAQEALGLKGERLSKLQLVLKEKEEALIVLKEQMEHDDGKTVDNGGDGTGEDTCAQEGLAQVITPVSESSLGGTINDPFVIE